MKSSTHPESDCACTVFDCRRTCAIEVVDDLLSSHGAARGREVDLLLDLRCALARASDAEQVIELFFALKQLMEQRRPVSFYRLRRWLENHVVALVRVNGRAGERMTRLTLNRSCLEAVKSGCVLAARRPGEPLNDTSVRLSFVEASGPVKFARKGPFVIRL